MPSRMMNDPIHMNRESHGQVDRQGQGYGGQGVDHCGEHQDKHCAHHVLGQIGQQHAQQEQEVRHRQEEENLGEKVGQVDTSEEEETAKDGESTEDADEYLNLLF